MTGVEFLERTIEPHPEIIRMLLTGYTDTEALIQAINVGRIYQYIQKALGSPGAQAHGPAGVREL
jgi:response regulator RpfG family c-di-GMP phosphodiesterase